MRNNPPFEEKITSKRTQFLFVLFLAIFLSLFYWRFSSNGIEIMSGIFLFLTFFFAFYTINFRILSTRIVGQDIHIQFGVIHWNIPLSSIEEVRIDEASLWRIGGAGVHFSPIRGRYRAMFNFLEYPRIVVSLKEKRGLVRDVAFSTERPNEILRLIKSKMVNIDTAQQT